MPILPEKIPQASALPVHPSEVLRLRHRWERWHGVLLVVLVGFDATFVALGLFHLYLQTPENWNILAGIWAGGFFLTILAAIVGWRLAPSSLLDTAQQMDRDRITKNRLEATATLQDSSSPLALAQREETAAYLSREPGGARPECALPWLVGGILVLVAAHLVMLALWMVPILLHPPLAHSALSQAAGQHPPVPVPPPSSKELPKASIILKSPEPESKANPVEEVPTVAVTQSTTGLKNLSLEISVNGLPKKSVPLPATPYDQPGKNTLKASLYMDELGVDPFDMVTYFIRGERITDQKVPDTTSAIQFIQVRPFRDDASQKRGGPGIKVYDLLIRLKLAQLRAIKENFILAHTDLAVTNPVRVKENERVGQNQAELSAKTEEVVQAFMETKCAGIIPVIDLLRQAEPPMDEAGKKILATQNVPALPPQGKALSLIVAVEKLAHKVLGYGGSAPNDNPDDPFKDKQQHELKKRMEVAAGQLETLAKNQARLANDLIHPNSLDAGNPPDATPAQNNPAGPSGANPDDSQKVVPLPPTQAVDPFGPDAGNGTFAERQARVLQGIETLLNTNTVFPDAVNGALQDAQKDATESMRNLDLTDNGGAREPAANAAQDLQRAIAEMTRAGEQETKLVMEEGQEKLNDLARQLRDLAQKGSPDAQQHMADLAQQIRDARKQLDDAADKQQEAGSAAGALRLEHLANAIMDRKVESDLSDMARKGLDANKAAAVADNLEALAGQAAQGTMAGKPSARDLANLIASLERSRANLARLAQQVGGSIPPTTGASGKPGDQGAGKDPGKDQKGQGQGQGQGQGEGRQPGQGNASTPGSGGGPGSTGGGQRNQENPPATTADGTTTSPGEANGTVDKAYREMIADLKNEAQLTNATVSDANAATLVKSILHIDQDSRYRPVGAVNIIHGYQAIAAPLDQLIAELQAVVAHMQREEVVKQPDLDEAPPAYRPAVSDYFETMSKDYHPDSGNQDTKKP